ncbi:hypothetical protein BC829DRAFT_392025 [Chytridium lagenaria]|nr:hypothetical protein BC829DRAFT_392025 [Chytridium lagenaria]
MPSPHSRRLLLVVVLALSAVISHAAPKHDFVFEDNRDMIALQASSHDDGDYRGHQLVRVEVSTHLKRRRREVERVIVEKLGLDLWAARKEGLDVSPCLPTDLGRLNLALANLAFNVPRPTPIISDLQDLISREHIRLQTVQQAVSRLYPDPVTRVKATKDWFSEYHRYEDIKYGKTALGEDIFALKIGSSVGKGVKPQVWEWIGPATVQYFVHRLLTTYGKDAEATTVLDTAELIIVPLMNADGYKYTWDKSRLWRKNRRPIKGDILDLWELIDVFMGPSAGSEPEVKALMQFFMNKNHTRLVGAIDFHSYSQLILRPYGWTEDAAPDEKLLKKVGDGIRETIKATHGKKYTSERAIDLYQCSGTASDWFYDDQVQTWLPDRRLYAYTIELRPSPDETWGNQGFILPPEQIIPTGEEIYNSVVYFVKEAVANPLLVKKN